MLRQLIRHRREAILDAWFGAIVDRYPAETARFLRGTRDPFDNPVGSALREGLGSLLDLATEDGEVDAARAAMDRIIRIRAVQDFSPSQAVSFVLRLKRAIRAELGNGAGQGPQAVELAELEEDIDRLALVAFDIYVRCREQVYELRINEVKRRVSALWRRFEREGSGQESDPGTSDEGVSSGGGVQ